MSQTNAVGRRKASIARVYIQTGSGNITINQRDINDYFTVDFLKLAVTEPLRILGAEASYDIKVNVKGGGIKGQAEAIRLGIARALVKHNAEKVVSLERDGQTLELNEVKVQLKEANRNILTRDPRVVERKKAGLRKARRATQFSKR
ncbi:MAG: 30S ribosomal protein S9 [Chitinophagales bacterium]|nr:30S ribosomal protein S9 [Bacteroidota bacterium]